MLFSVFSVLSALHVAAAATVARQSANGVATVDLASRTGEARFLGSGFIYGFPEGWPAYKGARSIPEYLVRDFKFNACRAGGAQLPEPSLGWADNGYDTYVGRLESTIGSYRVTREYGADFILLPHDLWGSDGGGVTHFPGDNGNWTEMEVFYNQLIGDLVENNLLEGLVFDIWNEPELDSFWDRDWDQYLDYYVRAHNIVREKLPDTLISGPSGAHAPHVDNEQWNTWMARVSETGAIPDRYSWHQIGEWEREPDRSMIDFNILRERYGLPERPIDINEYAWPDEQNPANTAWYLAQLERHNMRGLRANWAGGEGLHDMMGDMVFFDGEYHPNGEWYLYKYYAGMTGETLATTASSDYRFDAFATISDNVVKVIAGTRTVAAPYELKITGLTALGLPDKGTIGVVTRQFNWDGKGADTGDNVDLGMAALSYADNTLIIPFNPPTASTAFAFEFAGPMS